MNAASVDAIEAEIRRRIDTIIDPCSAATGQPVGLVTLGLLKRLEIDPGPDGADVRVWLRLTGPGCLMGPVFVQEVQARLADAVGVQKLHVELDYRLDWEPTDMAPEYRIAVQSVRAKIRRDSEHATVGADQCRSSPYDPA